MHKPNTGNKVFIWQAIASLQNKSPLNSWSQQVVIADCIFYNVYRCQRFFESVVVNCATGKKLNNFPTVLLPLLAELLPLTPVQFQSQRFTVVIQTDDRIMTVVFPQLCQASSSSLINV